MTNKQACQKLLRELEALNLKPYLYHHSLYCSYYIRFMDNRLKSVRISDHEGRSKYRYKWNFRADLKLAKILIDRGVRRFYFPFSQISGMAHRIKYYYDTILKTEKVLGVSNGN